MRHHTGKIAFTIFRTTLGDGIFDFAPNLLGVLLMAAEYAPVLLRTILTQLFS